MGDTEDFMSQAVEEPPASKRKRRKYRRYPRPECSPAEAALVARQGSRCGICRQVTPEKDLMIDHSYRTGATRGLLDRQCNAALGISRIHPRVYAKHWPT